MNRYVASAAVAVLLAVVAGAAGAHAQGSTQQARGSDPAAIVPYKISIDEGVINDLKVRLARTRFPDEIPGTGWEYGTDLNYLKGLVAYWRNGFDWRAAERRLNELEQFTTTIDGVQIHFIHQKSKDPKAMPLAITHGWPGSIFEFSKVIGPLTDPERTGGKPGDAFNVVAISLPGFGFSGHPATRGYSPERMAKIIATLMARLGYTKYGVQGGDWGGIISRLVALNDAEHVAGLHLNFCVSGAPSEGDPNEGIPREQLVLMESRNKFMENERAYQQLQATKPQTLGFGLTDSPAGLAAWIVEKFRAWCDCDGNVEKKFSKDDLLTNITIYWATQTATSSARIYFENRVASPNQGKVSVPTACAVFPKEIVAPPRRWLESRYNLTRYTVMPRGGHFAALEEPQLLVDDIRTFFRDLR